MMKRKVRTCPQPSSFAASSNSLGRPMKNCRSRKMLNPPWNAPPNHAGSQSGTSVPINPILENIT